jgi:hypothetical protein
MARSRSNADSPEHTSSLDVSGDVLENIDPIFYGDLRTAGFKALGLN